MFDSSEANGACKWAHCLALPSTNWKLFQIKSDNAGETRRDKHGFGRLCLAAGRIHPDNPYLSSISSTSSIHLGPPTKRSHEVTPTRGISSRHFKTIEAINELVREMKSSRNFRTRARKGGFVSLSLLIFGEIILLSFFVRGLNVV